MIKGLIKSLVGDASNIIDAVVTTDEERLDAKRKLKEIILSHEAELQRNVTDRWKADMASDSWLSKNVRPMVLLFLIVCTMLLIFIDAGTLSFTVEDKWTDLLQLVLITVIGAYFGGRSAEKLKGRGVFGMGGKKMMYKEGGDANFAAVAKRAKAAKKPK